MNKTISKDECVVDWEKTYKDYDEYQVYDFKYQLRSNLEIDWNGTTFWTPSRMDILWLPEDRRDAEKRAKNAVMAFRLKTIEPKLRYFGEIPY